MHSIAASLGRVLAVLDNDNI